MSAEIRKVRIAGHDGGFLEVEGNRIGARVTIEALGTTKSTPVTREAVRELRDFLTALLEDSGPHSLG